MSCGEEDDVALVPKGLKVKSLFVSKRGRSTAVIANNTMVIGLRRWHSHAIIPYG